MKPTRSRLYFRAALAASLSAWAAIFAIVALIYWSATAVITFMVIAALFGVISYIESLDAQLEAARRDAEETIENLIQQKQ
jgi:hypothetical protein